MPNNSIGTRPASGIARTSGRRARRLSSNCGGCSTPSSTTLTLSRTPMPRHRAALRASGRDRLNPSTGVRQNDRKKAEWAASSSPGSNHSALPPPSRIGAGANRHPRPKLRRPKLRRRRPRSRHAPDPAPNVLTRRKTRRGVRSRDMQDVSASVRREACPRGRHRVGRARTCVQPREARRERVSRLLIA